MTTYIEGRKPEVKNQDKKMRDIDEMLCKQALNTLNARGILHRDLRPDNFIITNHEGKEIAIIVDFAFAIIHSTRQQPEWLAAENPN